MKAKKLLSVFAAGALTLALVACGGQSADKPSQGGSGDGAGAKKICLILPGTVDDQGWNATNAAGAKACDSELGTKIDIVENVPPEEYEQTFVEYGEKGYDLIMAAGSQFDEPCTAVAENYPESKFCVINGTQSKYDNQCPVFPKEYEGSYLAGIIAGYASEDGQFAVLGGESNDPMMKLMGTYGGKAVEVAKERGIDNCAFKDTIMNTWTDVSKAKDLTSSMIDDGCDTVFCYSNEATSGSIQACADKGAKFVGFSSNKNAESDCVVGSVVMDWPHVYPTIVKNVMDGTYKGMVEIGVKEGVFKVEATDQMSDECNKALDESIAEINEGKVDFTKYFTLN